MMRTKSVGGSSGNGVDYDKEEAKVPEQEEVRKTENIYQGYDVVNLNTSKQ